ncbi:MAG: hypothetical protein BJ554DRAFT_2233 [Olpidium bornovanus]|uniref:Uncharacterized protein n=1 Tax=Olpidium bornovanus TaxID=278681 RepID=A0A8H8DGT7_9FUNG|nr:MAG: hypothetical protein BJ554DRAFT_2233 [Olpidium bornovanus]
MQARSWFANANSRKTLRISTSLTHGEPLIRAITRAHRAGGIQELTAQVTRAVGPRNRWLVRFFGNLKVAIENLNKAHSFLKENLEHTYAPLSAYLICVDHRLDRPASHPHAQLENCTRPAFGKTPVIRSRDGYNFPPANYHLVHVSPGE